MLPSIDHSIGHISHQNGTDLHYKPLGKEYLPSEDPQMDGSVKNVNSCYFDPLGGSFWTKGVPFC